MRLTTTICGAVIACVSTTLNAQTRAPYPLLKNTDTTATLGSFLEGPFERQLGFCVTGSEREQTLNIKKGLSSKQLSAIPTQLNDPSLGLDSHVYLNKNSSVGRAFAYVYTSQSMQVPTLDEGNYLLANYLEDPQLMTLAGLNSAIYDYSCSSSLAASLAANVGWSFSIAQISAALQGDATRKTSYHLAILSGTLYSPFFSQYNSSISPDWKTYAQMLLWEWYTRHPGAATDGTQRYLLEGFDGVALYKVSTTSATTDGKLDTKASLAIPSTSISASLSTTYNSSQNVTVNLYQLAERQGPGSVESGRFHRLESLATLANQIQANAHLDPKSSDFRLVPIATPHSQLISGIPNIICKGKWRPEVSAGANINGTLTYVTSAPVASTDTSAPPACSITILYTPNIVADGGKAPQHQTLNYSLYSDIPDPTNAGNKPLASAKFAADPVSLTASGLPSISSSGSQGAWDGGYPKITPAGGGLNLFSYQWTFAYPVTDDTLVTERISSVAPTLSDMTLSCPTGSRNISSTKGSSTTGTVSYSGGLLTVTVVHSSNSAAETLATDQIDICTLNGRVTFNLASGYPVVRDLPASQVLYPPLKPASVPAPVAPAPPAVASPAEPATVQPAPKPQ